MNCSICLTNFKDPLSLPCGHVYCTQCLVDYVNHASNPNQPNPDQGAGNELTALCPICRDEFQLAKPDLIYLPQKYHRFVTPPARRIYLDFSAEQALEDELKKAKEIIWLYTRQEKQLLQKCDTLEYRVGVHKDDAAGAREICRGYVKLMETYKVLLDDSNAKLSNEREANKRIWEEMTRIWEEDVRNQNEESERMKEENEKMKEENARVNKANEELQGRLENQARAQMRAELESLRDEAQSAPSGSRVITAPFPLDDAIVATVKRSPPSSEPRAIRALPRQRKGRQSSPPQTSPSTKRPRLSAANPWATQTHDSNRIDLD